jgi:hypothetical protein
MPLDVQRPARDVAELFASDVKGTLPGLAPELATRRNRELGRDVLERRLATMLALDKAQDPANRSSTLPVANLKPSDVIEQRKVTVRGHFLAWRVARFRNAHMKNQYAGIGNLYLNQGFFVSTISSSSRDAGVTLCRIPGTASCRPSA